MAKNEAAVALGRKRWKGTSRAQRKAHAAILTESRRTITPEQRTAIAKKAAAARWGAKKKAGKKT